MELQLRICGEHYIELKDHLLSSDGFESVAMALCGRFVSSDRIILTVHQIILIPNDECVFRSAERVIWNTRSVLPYFNKINVSSFALLKIHSHPNGYSSFSEIDDKSDKEFFDSVFGWSCDNMPHASAVMLPDGNVFGRLIYEDLSFHQIEHVSIVGDLIRTLKISTNNLEDEFAKRTIQAFGAGTYAALKGMTIGVVGCSGTGSVIIEQLFRLGVGRLVIADPDLLEEKNLNRILNSKKSDAIENKSKVKVLEDFILNAALGTEVESYNNNLYDNTDLLRALIKCDVIFGCMDSVDGRHLLNQLCTFYILPYFDIGVKLNADGSGGIDKICASVNYIQPGKSSLITRGLYNIEDLRSAAQLRKNPLEFTELQKHSYIKNINVNSPAVISVNMNIASHAINEFLNRIHPYKSDESLNYALSTIDMTENCIINVSEKSFETDNYLKSKVGRGDVVPFIELSELK